MRLFPGKIPTIATEVTQALLDGQDIETSAPAEVRADLESVLKEYLRQEKDIVEEAKRRMEIRGAPYAELGKVRSQVAKERKFPASDDTLPYLLDQILSMLFHSNNVDEVFSEDTTLRKKITGILRKHMEVEQELDREVRSKIKNLEEGTATFEVEYAKVLEQMKRSKRLT